MPPKKSGSSTAYQRLQKRDKNKEMAGKKEVERLEQVEVDKVRKADEEFKTNMALQSLSMRLNGAAVKYLDKQFRAGLDVAAICD